MNEDLDGVQPTTDTTHKEDREESLEKWTEIQKILRQFHRKVTSICGYCKGNLDDCKICAMGPNHYHVCDGLNLQGTDVGKAAEHIASAVMYCQNIINAIHHHKHYIKQQAILVADEEEETSKRNKDKLGNLPKNF